MNKMKTVIAEVLFIYAVFFQVCTEDQSSKNELIIVENMSEDDTDSTTLYVEDEEQYIEKFQPTKEWQTIKPGQAIPAGLHIRIDMQSGKKEARIMEETPPQKQETDGDQQLVDLEEENSVNKKHKTLDPKELKKALKLLKSDEQEKSNKDSEEVKKKFRSIDDLKKEFSDLNMSIKTETELLIEQMEKYRREENKATVLQDLEFLVHQYDVAQDFVKKGGIDLLLPDLNSTDAKIRSLVAFTLGSAMQGNPKVQIAILESSAMPNLLRLMMLDPSSEVQARSLYALSCLLRQFPIAQKKFVESGGITILADIFRHQQTPPLKLQVKVVTLLHDLLLEKHLAEKYSLESDKIQQEKLRQYKSFQLDAALRDNGFCSFLPKLLSAPDYDVHEKVINAMQSLVHICKEAFSSSLNKLHHLAKFYEKAAIEEAMENVSQEEYNMEEFYFASVYKAVNNLIKSVNPSSKTEL